MNLKLLHWLFLISLGITFVQANDVQKNTQEVIKSSEETSEVLKKSESLLTKIVTKLEKWNENYILPLSYGYIFLDLGQKFFGLVKNYFTLSKGRIATINPLNPGNDSFNKKVASTVIDVAKKVGTKVPSSVIIYAGKRNAYTDGYAIRVEKSFFEDALPKAAEFTIGHELGHIKKRHVLIRKLALIISMVGGSFFLLETDEKNAINEMIAKPLEIIKKKYKLENNEYYIDDLQRIVQLVFTSPLLYYLLGKIAWYKLSRYQEKQADMIAATAVGPEGGIFDFKKLAQDHTHTTSLFDTHPCPQERVDYLQAFAK